VVKKKGPGALLAHNKFNAEIFGGSDLCPNGYQSGTYRKGLGRSMPAELAGRVVADAEHPHSKGKLGIRKGATILGLVHIRTGDSTKKPATGLVQRLKGRGMKTSSLM